MKNLKSFEIKFYAIIVSQRDKPYSGGSRRDSVGSTEPPLKFYVEFSNQIR